MIRAKSKKIAAILTAFAVTASMIPAMAAPGFAAETEPADVTEAETMMVEPSESMPGQPEAIEEDEALAAEEETIDDSEAAAESSAEAEAPAAVSSSKKSLNSSSSGIRDVTKWMSLSDKPNTTVVFRGSFNYNEVQWLAFKTSNRDSFYQIKLVNSNGNVLYPRFCGPDKEELVWSASVGEHDSWNFEAYHRRDNCENESKLMKNTTYYLRMATNDRIQKSVNYTVYLTEYPDDIGDCSATAKKIGLGTVSAASQGKDTDDDWMKFVAPAGGNYVVTIRNQMSGADLSWKYYDQYEERLGGEWLGTNRSAQIDWSLSKGATRHIRIHCFDRGKYSVTVKRVNPIKVSAKTKKFKKNALKKSKKRFYAISVKNAQGKVTYTKVSGSKALKINKNTGKLTLKKKAGKGTYTIRVKVTAAGNGQYTGKASYVKVKVKVK